MHRNAEYVQTVLRSMGHEGTVIEIDRSTRTAADAAQALETSIGQIAKSLVFRAGAEVILVIASGANRVSQEKLGRHLGCTVERADADMAKQISGFPIGGIPPIGHKIPLRSVIDKNLSQYSEIWAAAGTPHAVFSTTPEELIRITGGEVVDISAGPE
jgi:prolyl-tRNA editing enzyme YbaK/EbsC (Cys-tRNA(Pro) deacylase)